MAHIVPRLCKRYLGSLVEPFKNVNFDWAALAATDVIQDAVDSLLGVVSRDSGLRIC